MSNYYHGICTTATGEAIKEVVLTDSSLSINDILDGDLLSVYFSNESDLKDNISLKLSTDTSSSTGQAVYVIAKNEDNLKDYKIESGSTVLFVATAITNTSNVNYEENAPSYANNDIVFELIECSKATSNTYGIVRKYDPENNENADTDNDYITYNDLTAITGNLETKDASTTEVVNSLADLIKYLQVKGGYRPAVTYESTVKDDSKVALGVLKVGLEDLKSKGTEYYEEYNVYTNPVEIPKNTSSFNNDGNDDSKGDKGIFITDYPSQTIKFVGSPEVDKNNDKKYFLFSGEGDDKIGLLGIDDNEYIYGGNGIKYGNTIITSASNTDKPDTYSGAAIRSNGWVAEQNELLCDRYSGELYIQHCYSALVHINKVVGNCQDYVATTFKKADSDDSLTTTGKLYSNSSTKKVLSKDVTSVTLTNKNYGNNMEATDGAHLYQTIQIGRNIYDANKATTVDDPETCPFKEGQSWTPVAIVNMNQNFSNSLVQSNSESHKADARFLNLWECFVVDRDTPNEATIGYSFCNFSDSHRFTYMTFDIIWKRNVKETKYVVETVSDADDTTTNTETTKNSEEATE